MPVTSAISVAIAEAVTNRLKASELRNACDDIERSYADWTVALENERRRIDVVAVSTEQEVDLADRGSFDMEVPITIAVRKRIGKGNFTFEGKSNLCDEDGVVDALVKLVEDVWLLFAPQSLAGDDTFTEFEWLATKIIVNPHRQLLFSMNQFLGIVRTTFRYTKEIAW